MDKQSITTNSTTRNNLSDLSDGLLMGSICEYKVGFNVLRGIDGKGRGFWSLGDRCLFKDVHWFISQAGFVNYYSRGSRKLTLIRELLVTLVSEFAGIGL